MIPTPDRSTTRPVHGALRPRFLPPRRQQTKCLRPCTACTLTARPGDRPTQILRDAGRPFLEVETRRLPLGLPDAAFGRLTKGLLAIAGPEYPEFVSFSYITHFVEVRVEPTTRRIRVPRVVSVADCGRVVSPRTARSQVNGGVVWGIGCALREASEVDSRFGGFLNADIAEYLVPVNADIGDIDVDFINQPDFQSWRAERRNRRVKC